MLFNTNFISKLFYNRSIFVLFLAVFLVSSNTNISFSQDKSKKVIIGKEDWKIQFNKDDDIKSAIKYSSGTNDSLKISTKEDKAGVLIITKDQPRLEVTPEGIIKVGVVPNLSSDTILVYNKDTLGYKLDKKAFEQILRPTTGSDFNNIAISKRLHIEPKKPDGTDTPTSFEIDAANFTKSGYFYVENFSGKDKYIKWSNWKGQNLMNSSLTITGNDSLIIKHKEVIKIEVQVNSATDKYLNFFKQPTISESSDYFYLNDKSITDFSVGEYSTNPNKYVGDSVMAFKRSKNEKIRDPLSYDDLRKNLSNISNTTSENSENSNHVYLFRFKPGSGENNTTSNSPSDNVIRNISEKPIVFSFKLNRAKEVISAVKFESWDNSSRYLEEFKIRKYYSSASQTKGYPGFLEITLTNKNSVEKGVIEQRVDFGDNEIADRYEIIFTKVKDNEFIKLDRVGFKTKSVLGVVVKKAFEEILRPTAGADFNNSVISKRLHIEPSVTATNLEIDAANFTRSGYFYVENFSKAEKKLKGTNWTGVNFMNGTDSSGVGELSFVNKEVIKVEVQINKDGKKYLNFSKQNKAFEKIVRPKKSSDIDGSVISKRVVIEASQLNNKQEVLMLEAGDFTKSGYFYIENISDTTVRINADDNWTKVKSIGGLPTTLDVDTLDLNVNSIIKLGVEIKDNGDKILTYIPVGSLASYSTKERKVGNIKDLHQFKILGKDNKSYATLVDIVRSTTNNNVYIDQSITSDREIMLTYLETISYEGNTNNTLNYEQMYIRNLNNEGVINKSNPIYIYMDLGIRGNILDTLKINSGAARAILKFTVLKYDNNEKLVDSSAHVFTPLSSIPYRPGLKSYKMNFANNNRASRYYRIRIDSVEQSQFIKLDYLSFTLKNALEEDIKEPVKAFEEILRPTTSTDFNNSVISKRLHIEPKKPDGTDTPTSFEVDASNFTKSGYFYVQNFSGVNKDLEWKNWNGVNFMNGTDTSRTGKLTFGHKDVIRVEVQINELPAPLGSQKYINFSRENVSLNTYFVTNRDVPSLSNYRKYVIKNFFKIEKDDNMVDIDLIARSDYDEDEVSQEEYKIIFRKTARYRKLYVNYIKKKESGGGSEFKYDTLNVRYAPNEDGDIEFFIRPYKLSGTQSRYWAHLIRCNSCENVNVSLIDSGFVSVSDVTSTNDKYSGTVHYEGKEYSSLQNNGFTSIPAISSVPTLKQVLLKGDDAGGLNITNADTIYTDVIKTDTTIIDSVLMLANAKEYKEETDRVLIIDNDTVKYTLNSKAFEQILRPTTGSDFNNIAISKRLHIEPKKPDGTDTPTSFEIDAANFTKSGYFYVENFSGSTRYLKWKNNWNGVNMMNSTRTLLINDSIKIEHKEVIKIEVQVNKDGKKYLNFSKQNKAFEKIVRPKKSSDIDGSVISKRVVIEASQLNNKQEVLMLEAGDFTKSGYFYIENISDTTVRINADDNWTKVKSIGGLPTTLDVDTLDLNVNSIIKLGVEIKDNGDKILTYIPVGSLESYGTKLRQIGSLKDLNQFSIFGRDNKTLAYVYDRGRTKDLNQTIYADRQIILDYLSDLRTPVNYDKDIYLHNINKDEDINKNNPIYMYMDLGVRRKVLDTLKIGSGGGRAIMKFVVLKYDNNEKLVDSSAHTFSPLSGIPYNPGLRTYVMNFANNDKASRYYRIRIDSVQDAKIAKVEYLSFTLKNALEEDTKEPVKAFEEILRPTTSTDFNNDVISKRLHIEPKKPDGTDTPTSFEIDAANFAKSGYFYVENFSKAEKKLKGTNWTGVNFMNGTDSSGLGELSFVNKEVIKVEVQVNSPTVKYLNFTKESSASTLKQVLLKGDNAGGLNITNADTIYTDVVKTDTTIIDSVLMLANAKEYKEETDRVLIIDNDTVKYTLNSKAFEKIIRPTTSADFKDSVISKRLHIEPGVATTSFEIDAANFTKSGYFYVENFSKAEKKLKGTNWTGVNFMNGTDSSGLGELSFVNKEVIKVEVQVNSPTVKYLNFTKESSASTLKQVLLKGDNAGGLNITNADTIYTDVVKTDTTIIDSVLMLANAKEYKEETDRVLIIDNDTVKYTLNSKAFEKIIRPTTSADFKDSVISKRLHIEPGVATTSFEIDAANFTKSGYFYVENFSKAEKKLKGTNWTGVNFMNGTDSSGVGELSFVNKEVIKVEVQVNSPTVKYLNFTKESSASTLEQVLSKGDDAGGLDIRNADTIYTDVIKTDTTIVDSVLMLANAKEYKEETDRVLIIDNDTVKYTLNSKAFEKILRPTTSADFKDSVISKRLHIEPGVAATSFEIDAANFTKSGYFYVQNFSGNNKDLEWKNWNGVNFMNGTDTSRAGKLTFGHKDVIRVEVQVNSPTVKYINFSRENVSPNTYFVTNRDVPSLSNYRKYVIKNFFKIEKDDNMVDIDLIARSDYDEDEVSQEEYKIIFRKAARYRKLYVNYIKKKESGGGSEFKYDTLNVRYAPNEDGDIEFFIRPYSLSGTQSKYWTHLIRCNSCENVNVSLIDSGFVSVSDVTSTNDKYSGTVHYEGPDYSSISNARFTSIPAITYRQPKAFEEIIRPTASAGFKDNVISKRLHIEPSTPTSFEINAANFTKSGYFYVENFSGSTRYLKWKNNWNGVNMMNSTRTLLINDSIKIEHKEVIKVEVQINKDGKKYLNFSKQNKAFEKIVRPKKSSDIDGSVISKRVVIEASQLNNKQEVLMLEAGDFTKSGYFYIENISDTTVRINADDNWTKVKSIGGLPTTLDVDTLDLNVNSIIKLGVEIKDNGDKILTYIPVGSLESYGTKLRQIGSLKDLNQFSIFGRDNKTLAYVYDRGRTKDLNQTIYADRQIILDYLSDLRTPVNYDKDIYLHNINKDEDINKNNPIYMYMDLGVRRKVLDTLKIGSGGGRAIMKFVVLKYDNNEKLVDSSAHTFSPLSGIPYNPGLRTYVMNFANNDKASRYYRIRIDSVQDAKIAKVEYLSFTLKNALEEDTKEPVKAFEEILRPTTGADFNNSVISKRLHIEPKKPDGTDTPTSFEIDAANFAKSGYFYVENFSKAEKKLKGTNWTGVNFMNGTDSSGLGELSFVNKEVIKVEVQVNSPTVKYLNFTKASSASTLKQVLLKGDNAGGLNITNADTIYTDVVKTDTTIIDSVLMLANAKEYKEETDRVLIIDNDTVKYTLNSKAFEKIIRPTTSADFKDSVISKRLHIEPGVATTSFEIDAANFTKSGYFYVENFSGSTRYLKWNNAWAGVNLMNSFRVLSKIKDADSIKVEHKEVIKVEVEIREGVGKYLNFTKASNIFESVEKNHVRLINENDSVAIGKDKAETKLDVAGTITAYSIVQKSDRRLKENIKTLTGALEKIKQIRGVNYNLKKEKLDNPEYRANKEVGFIAQEVKKVIPELVVELNNKEKLLTVMYDRITAYLVEAIKEQQNQIETMFENITHKNKEIENIKADMTKMKNENDIKIDNITQMLLEINSKINNNKIYSDK